MTPEPLPTPYPRDCWCGDYRQFPWSDEFNVCLVCGTLVSRAKVTPEALRVRKDEGELYSKDYWLKRQGDKYGLPAIHARARNDLPERCAHWLKQLLRHKLPLPGTSVLELGCAHGGFVALLQWAGYAAAGVEMSPWVVEFARQTFGADVVVGPLEEQKRWAPSTLDAIVMSDVIEHLPNPLQTLGDAAKRLKPDGVFLIQTPEYKEHLSWTELVAAGDLATRPMAGKNEEHLFLYSRRGTQRLWEQLGFKHLVYLNALFPYDMSYVVSREPLVENPAQKIEEALARTPSGRLVQALIDKYDEAEGWKARAEAGARRI